MIKKIFAVSVAVIMIFALAACNMGTGDNSNPNAKNAETLRKEAVALIQWYRTEKVGANADLSELDVTIKSYGGELSLSNSDMTVVGVAAYYGVEADYDAYVAKLETAFNELYADRETLKNVSPSALYTLARMLTAMDKDPRDFCGTDLISYATNRNESFKNIYSTPYILTVIDEYGLRDSDKALADSTVEWLFSEQHDDGGWGYEDFLSGEKVTDPDGTAMVLAGLAPFVSENDGNMKRAWECLRTYKNENGSYKSSYSDGSSDTTIEVLVAAIAAGKNPFDDEGFVTNGKNLIEIIMTFKNSDGGLRSGLEDAPSNDISVVNALDALYHASVLLNNG